MSSGPRRLRSHRRAGDAPAHGACDVLHGQDLSLGIREGALTPDGVTEARAPDGEMFGLERLRACVREHAAAGTDALVQAIRGAVAAFCDGRTLADDLTYVAARLVPYEAPAVRARSWIGSSLDELHRAREFVERFCRTLPEPLAEDRIAGLVLAVNEAASNIMKHADQGHADQRIELMAEAFRDRVAIRLRYQGAPFDPSAVPPTAFDGSRDSGFGIFMIANSVDEVGDALAALDRPTAAFLRAVAGRATHGDLAAAALLLPEVALAALGFDAAESALLAPALAAFRTWYEHDRPAIADGTAWDAARMAYSFDVSAAGPGQRRERWDLRAADYDGSKLDWYNFALVQTTRVAGDAAPAPERRAVPTPLTFRGMPNPRWWQFEDGRTDVGAVEEPEQVEPEHRPVGAAHPHAEVTMTAATGKTTCRIVGSVGRLRTTSS